MADETPPLDEARLTEIRNGLAGTRAEMDAWYQAHPNPQWRREHPFDYDSIVANTYTYITIPALLAEVDRLRAREAAALAIVRVVADNAEKWRDWEHITTEDINLIEEIAEKARALLAQE